VTIFVRLYFLELRRRTPFTPFHRAGYHLPDPVSRPIDRLVQIPRPLLQHQQFMRKSNSQSAALVVSTVPGTVYIADIDTYDANSLRKAIQGKSEPSLDMSPDSICKRKFPGPYLNVHIFLQSNLLNFGDARRRTVSHGDKQAHNVRP
jgi:hypothetical protein